MHILLVVVVLALSLSLSLFFNLTSSSNFCNRIILLQRNRAPTMEASIVTVVFVVTLILVAQLSSFASAQKPKPTWLTLDGNAPRVIARGGFSGLFPDSSAYAYGMVMSTSVPDAVLWCDVQLTQDAAGICFPGLRLENSSYTDLVYPKRENTYEVNGDSITGYFPIDFTLKELSKVSLRQGSDARSPDFDGSMFSIQTVDNVTQNKAGGYWLNIQHDAFYSQHNLSMRGFVISASKRVLITQISSPEVKFLQSLASPFAKTRTKLVFRFLEKDAAEPTTNQKYGSLLKNLTFIKTFASGILVPKTYIWPVDKASYLLPHTTLVADAHKIGLAVYASDFANDNVIAYNYSYNPISEYLSYIDNGNFSVDGVLSDFPITPSEARDCFSHVGKNASAKVKPLVITHYGASGDFPACTDMSYTKAISDEADVIDCPVQMSKDGVPFCLRSINLMNSTEVGQTQFSDLLKTVHEIQPGPGIFSFSMNWEDIKGLTPVMYNPFPGYFFFRNPKFRNAGKLISLADFLALAKNATSISGVLIDIENADYLASNVGVSVIDAVMETLDKAGYNSPSAKKVMIQSSDSSVLKAMKTKKYELVYRVNETISDVLSNAAKDIKTFAHSVIVIKNSVYIDYGGFLKSMTDVVSHLHSSKLQVYVLPFRNEFISQAYDFFSDPIVEMNSYVMAAGIDGIITEFPQTAVAYKKNHCLKMKKTPTYMSPVTPGQLFQLMAPSYMPPAEAPWPDLTVGDVSEAPLSPVTKQNATAPITSSPTTSTPPSSQERSVASAMLSCLTVIVTNLLFW